MQNYPSADMPGKIPFRINAYSHNLGQVVVGLGLNEWYRLVKRREKWHQAGKSTYVQNLIFIVPIKPV